MIDIQYCYRMKKWVRFDIPPLPLQEAMKCTETKVKQCGTCKNNYESLQYTQV